MQPLSQNELEGMRDTLAGVQTTLVEVWRRTSISDPGGGQTDTWSKVHTYKALFYGNAGVERQTPTGIVETITDFSFTFAYDVDIHQQDHLVFDDRTFNVERVGGSTEEVFIGLIVGANEIV